MTKHRKARLGKRAEEETGKDSGEPAADPVFEGFTKGQKVSIHNSDGSTTPAIYVGEGESSTFFGGPPMVYVVIEGADEGAAVELDRVTAR
jgi:hypothetical protein